MPSINDYRRDLAAEEEGVWRDVLYGIRVRIARLGSPAFKREQERLRREYEKDYPTWDSMPEDLALEINQRAFSRACIRDWNVTDGEPGKEEPVPYTADVAFRYISDPELKDFWDALWLLAQDGNAYRKRVLQLAGNSGGGSGTKSSGGRTKKS